MNDAERDAWLREALRHAPDSDALPPSGVSEAILLKARAAARAGATSPRRATTGIAPPANPLAAFWAWLARPPVAAGFASVMAATLVGLMWWDRPMDETMPRPPALASDRTDKAPPLAATAPATAAAPPPTTAPAPAAAPQALPADATKAATPARSEVATTPAADDREVERRQKSALEQSAAGNNAQVAEPATAPAKRKVETLAKERALAAERKNEAPAPFPSSEAQREMPAAAAPKSLDAAATDAKKDAVARRSPAADALDRAVVPPASPSVAPAPPPAIRLAPPAAATMPAPTKPLAGGRLAADEGRPAGAMQSDAAMAKSSAGAAPAPGPAPAATPAPPREVAAAPFGERAQRQRALGDAREKDAAGFASSAPAAVATPSPAPAPTPTPFRNELERATPDSTTRAAAAKQGADPAPRADAPARSDAATRADAPAQADASRAAPLTQLLAAIGADPARWSRQTARGDTVALDAGWRAWLAELDAAAAGRWRALGGGAASADGDAARDGTTTLRLVSAGRVAAVVRSDGATVHVDASPGTGAERWQATLSPASAERLRTTARRLSP
jgi:hypothetical protein